MKMHVYYIKCNTNVLQRDFGEVVVWRGRIPCIYIQGNGVSCAKKVGTELAQQRSLGSTVFDGGFLQYEKRGMVPREFSGQSRGEEGVEWNGMESSIVPVGRGGAEEPRGLKIDNAIPRLPLPPSTQLAPALLSFLLLCFSCSLLLLRPLSLPSSGDPRVLEMLTP